VEQEQRSDRRDSSQMDRKTRREKREEVTGRPILNKSFV
jgi:hypothetical protein